MLLLACPFRTVLQGETALVLNADAYMRIASAEFIQLVCTQQAPSLAGFVQPSYSPALSLSLCTGQGTCLFTAKHVSCTSRIL